MTRFGESLFQKPTTSFHLMSGIGDDKSLVPLWIKSFAIKGGSLFRNRTFSRSHRNRKMGIPGTGGAKRTRNYGRSGNAEETTAETKTRREQFSERTTIFPRGGLHKPQGRRSLFLHLVPPYSSGARYELFPVRDFLPTSKWSPLYYADKV